MFVTQGEAITVTSRGILLELILLQNSIAQLSHCCHPQPSLHTMSFLWPKCNGTYASLRYNFSLDWSKPSLSTIPAEHYFGLSVARPGVEQDCSQEPLNIKLIRHFFGPGLQPHIVPPRGRKTLHMVLQCAVLLLPTIPTIYNSTELYYRD